jgi:uncharacterized protein (UPF0332 family)
MPRLSLELLQQANRLATNEPRRPRSASIRRSISASYYALFHFLIEESTELLLGAGGKQQAFRQLHYRSFQHNEMANICKEVVDALALPPKKCKLDAFRPLLSVHSTDLDLIARTFKDLQEHRHRADYDIRKVHTRADALKLAADARAAIDAWRRIKKADRGIVNFLALLLLYGQVVSMRV